MRNFFCTCLYILLHFTVNAQDNYRVTTYTVEDGLPQSSIDEIIQDKNGFLWVATAAGLTRFDGYTFKLYKKSTDPKSALSDRGYHFYLDHSKRLWMVSYYGISLYNSDTDDFTNIVNYESEKLANSKIVTRESHIYGEDEKYVWAGLVDYGMVRINKETLKPERIDIPGLKISNDPHSWYRGCIEDSKVWIVTNQDFVIYDIKNKTVTRVNIPVKGLININKKQIAAFNERGALIIDKKSLTYEQIYLTPDKVDPAINSISRVSDHELLLCSNSAGLMAVNISSKKVTQRITAIGQGLFRKPLSAACVYKDWSGNIWIGSFSSGLHKLTYPYRNFKLYRSDNIKGNMVTSIYADDQNVYVGSAGNGIDVFSRKTSFIKNVPLNARIKTITNTALIATPYRNTLLLLGYDIPLKGQTKPLSYNISTDEIKPLNPSVSKIYNQLKDQRNLRPFIFRNSDGSFLTNSGEYLISLKSQKNGELYPEIAYRFGGELLSCCFKDKDGILYIGTYKGLFFLKNGIWQRIKLPKSVEIKTINQDKTGNLWLGTDNGIYVLNKQYQIEQYFTEENHLSNEHVYGILRDNDDNMWFSHNNGLSVYLSTKKTFRHFFREDGLQSSEFNASAYFKAKDGELFFGGINGTTAFFPREILDNPNIPQVLITKINLFDSPYKGKQSSWITKSLELPYTDNSLSFEFALPEFSNPSGNKYSYFMQGVDKKWINSGNVRFARYPALRPGKYTFNVKAANNDGTWNAKASSLTITIIPPFWERTWFVFMAGMVIVLGLIYVISFVQKQKYKKQMLAYEVRQKIQLERERISRDLHDNVGTQLSLINKNIEGMLHPLRAIPDDEKERNLVNVSQTSKEVISTLRETIWALNKEEISLEEFSDKLKSFVQKQIEVSPDLHLKFMEKIDNSIILSSSETIHLFRICQEAIVNSLKYADASMLQIDVLERQGKYQLSIRDDGKGFDPSLKDTIAHYGLENMKFRARELACDLTIHSAPAEGTVIIITKN